MVSQKEFAEDSDGSPPLRQRNQPGVGPLLDAAIRHAATKNADVKASRIQPPDDLARVGHLGVGKALVSQAVHEDSHRGHTEPDQRPRLPRRNAVMLGGLPDSGARPF